MKCTNSKTRYEVAKGEEVTLVFSLSNFGEGSGKLTVVHSPDPNTSNELNPDSSSPNKPTYKFTISREVGNSEAVVYQCSFIGGTTVPNNASFELVVKGSAGGKCIGPTVTAQDNVKKISLRFKVVS